MDDNIAELDIYQGELKSDVRLIVEVEFENKRKGNVFMEPDWFGKDVTNDARHKNRSLAINGWPK